MPPEPTKEELCMQMLHSCAPGGCLGGAYGTDHQSTSLSLVSLFGFDVVDRCVMRLAFSRRLRDEATQDDRDNGAHVQR